MISSYIVQGTITIYTIYPVLRTVSLRIGPLCASELNSCAELCQWDWILLLLSCIPRKWIEFRSIELKIMFCAIEVQHWIESSGCRATNCHQHIVIMLSVPVCGSYFSSVRYCLLFIKRCRNRIQGKLMYCLSCPLDIACKLKKTAVSNISIQSTTQRTQNIKMILWWSYRRFVRHYSRVH